MGMHIHTRSCMVTQRHTRLVTYVHAYVHVHTPIPLYTQTHSHEFLRPAGSLATHRTWTPRRWMTPLPVPSKFGAM